MKNLRKLLVIVAAITTLIIVSVNVFAEQTNYSPVRYTSTEDEISTDDEMEIDWYYATDDELSSIDEFWSTDDMICKTSSGSSDGCYPYSQEDIKDILGKNQDSTSDDNKGTDSSSPETGDNVDLILMLTLGLGSVVTFSGYKVFRKRK